MRHMENDGREGRLPAMAPLANAYVPFQMENPPKYEARKGLVRARSSLVWICPLWGW